MKNYELWADHGSVRLYSNFKLNDYIREIESKESLETVYIYYVYSAKSRDKAVIHYL